MSDKEAAVAAAGEGSGGVGGGKAAPPLTVQDFFVIGEVLSGGGSKSWAPSFDSSFLVFVDADVMVEANCIARLIGPIERGEAEATVGNYSKDVSGMSFASFCKQLYIAKIYERRRDL